MKIFEEKEVSIVDAMGNDLALQKSFKELKCKPISIVSHHCRWEFPPLGTFKLNVDGAFSSNGLVAGVGAIFRDSKGEVIMSAGKKEHGAMNVVEIEGLAIIRGLQLCIHLGIHHLMIESDSLLVVTEFNSQEFSLVAIGSVVQEARDLMARFQSCGVQHINRSCNGVAHSLAKLGLSVQDVSLWWGAYPNVITKLLWVDSRTM